MAYARFGADSEVYLFDTAYGYECCYCAFDSDGYRTSDVEDFLRHVARHRLAGHRVPDGVEADIRSDL